MPATAQTALSSDFLYSLWATLYFSNLLDILSMIAVFRQVGQVLVAIVYLQSRLMTFFVQIVRAVG